MATRAFHWANESLPIFDSMNDPMMFRLNAIYPGTYEILYVVRQIICDETKSNQ